MKKSIFTFDEKEYYAEDVIDALKKAGIKKGDSIFVHSDLKLFGKINNKIMRNEFLDSFIEALKKTVGKYGNIIMPTFSYTFCKNEIFIPEITPSKVGILTEYFRKLEGVKRSIDPIFSVAVFGPDKEYFTDVGTNCFGKKSIFEKLYDKNAKIVFLGETFAITYIHFVEQICGVPYRFIKKFKGKIKIKNELKDFVFDYNVRPLDKNIDYNLEKIMDFLESKRALRKIKLGNSNIIVVNAIDTFNELKKDFENDIYTLLKENPEANNDNYLTWEIGKDMYGLVKKLFPICRSITGNGVRDTLKIIQEHIPLTIHEVPTGTKVFDWKVPKEWNIKDAYVMDEKGNKIINFKKNNLHVMGYSIPINKIILLSELQEHLYSLPEQPEAIPYVTSYYKERWGFCIAHKERKKLKEGKYRVFIDSELKHGSLTYGELIIPGKTKKEVFLSTYICHPSMANNELSGPAVTTFLAKYLLAKPRKYSYRIIFIPETIGSITYLSKNLEYMKKQIIAGFNITCVGDERTYSYLPTRNGDTYADRIALNVLNFKSPKFIKWSYLDRGSDERQYTAPGVDLPVVSIMRSRYGTYPEYHTSLDNLELITSKGLFGAYDIIKKCLDIIEENQKYKIKCLCEPELGRRGLYPTIGILSFPNEVLNMSNFISYADGKNDLIDISNIIHVPVWELYPIIEKLLKVNLLKK
jgi:aminopeptidase-like protein/aminoglycoside N3'-acetyltransferase